MFNWLVRKLWKEVEPLSTQRANKLVDLLRSDPKKWDFQQHWAEHPKFRVWIANEDYGLHVMIDEMQWTPSPAERAIIWEAFSDELRRRQDRALSRKFKEIDAALDEGA